MDKAQVITKDEDKVLDAELHTDLLNQSERDKITQAGEKIGDLAEAIANSNDGGIFNTYKENRYGNLFNKYAASQKEYLAMLGDPNLSDIDKRNVVNELIADFLKYRKYEGKMPEVIIGSKTEAVDSRYDGNERIFITKEDLNSPDVLSKLGHELGHFNTYDKDEKTAGNIEKKINVVINTSETNGEYNSQLEKLKDKYKDLPNGEKAIELQNKIPDEYKEKFAVPVPLPVLVGGVVLIGGYYYIQNSEENKETWNKFQEDLKKEWESVKDKGIAYAEFHQIYMEAFLAKQNIIIGAEEGIGTLPFPWEIPIKLPVHTGNTDVLPKEKTSPPPTSLGVGKEFDGPIVDPLLEGQDKDNLTTADKNPPKLNNKHIYFITAEGALEVKNTDMPKDYTLNEDGTVVGPKGGEYKQAGYTEDGKVIFVNNKEFFLFEGGKKKAVSSPGMGGIIQTGLTRPPLTKATKDKIKERYIDNKDGTFIHKLTGKKIIGPIDYGHIYSWENRRLIKAAESLGMDQATLNKYVNSRDNIFQFENHYENVSHENEKPGNDIPEKMLKDMKKFLEELRKNGK